MTPDDVTQREQAWRAEQGPGVAMRYKFRLDRDADSPRVCRTRAPLGCVHWWCGKRAVWKVARSPYSNTGVRYYCGAHCPDVPEGTP